MQKDKSSKYWGFLEQNEAIKDTIQPDSGAGIGKEVFLLTLSNTGFFRLSLHGGGGGGWKVVAAYNFGTI